jgi:hypothetical protein
MSMKTEETQADVDYRFHAQYRVRKAADQAMDLIPDGQRPLYCGYVSASLRAVISGCAPYNCLLPPVRPNSFANENASHEEGILFAMWDRILSAVQRFLKEVHGDEKFHEVETFYFLLKFQEEFDKSVEIAVKEARAKEAPHRLW